MNIYGMYINRTPIVWNGIVDVGDIASSECHLQIYAFLVGQKGACALIGNLYTSLTDWSRTGC
jgi:hypothetical protein